MDLRKNSSDNQLYKLYISQKVHFILDGYFSKFILGCYVAIVIKHRMV